MHLMTFNDRLSAPRFSRSPCIQSRARALPWHHMQVETAFSVPITLCSFWQLYNISGPHDSTAYSMDSSIAPELCVYIPILGLRAWAVCLYILFIATPLSQVISTLQWIVFECVFCDGDCMQSTPRNLNLLRSDLVLQKRGTKASLHLMCHAVKKE